MVVLSVLLIVLAMPAAAFYFIVWIKRLNKMASHQENVRKLAKLSYSLAEKYEKGMLDFQKRQRS